MLAILISVSCPTKTFAVDYGFYNANDILYYDPTCIVSGGTSGALIGDDNAEKILRFLVGKDLTLIQAAGIIGNFYEESGLDPTNVEKTPDTTDPDYRPEDMNGFGIAQWTWPSRQQAMYAYHQETGRSMVDLSFQLDWFWKEFTEGYAGGVVTLKEKTTISDAAVDFHHSYEGSNDTASMIQERVDSGTTIYEQFKPTIQDGSSSTSSSSGNTGAKTCNDSSTNGASQFINGFAFYDQNDPRWKDTAYGNSTIGAAGCGPSAMAMIITALTGQQITPVETATYGAENGTTADGGAGGSNWSLQTILGDHWGLKSTEISADVNVVNDVLKSGGLVITSGSGASPFTQNGHFIVIRAVTDSGKWLIGDSYKAENNTKEWDPTFIKDIVEKGNVYIWSVTK